MNNWYVHILLCKHDKLYTGIAKNVEERFVMHQNGTGAKFTQRNKPIKIVYTEKCGSLSSARKQEEAIKKLRKHQKEDLIRRVPIKYE